MRPIGKIDHGICHLCGFHELAKGCDDFSYVAVQCESRMVRTLDGVTGTKSIFSFREFLVTARHR